VVENNKCSHHLYPNTSSLETKGNKNKYPETIDTNKNKHPVDIGISKSIERFYIQETNILIEFIRYSFNEICWN